MNEEAPLNPSKRPEFGPSPSFKQVQASCLGRALSPQHGSIQAEVGSAITLELPIRLSTQLSLTLDRLAGMR